jgi:hypothetical protein
MKRFAKASKHHFLVILPPSPPSLTYLDEYAVRKLKVEPGAGGLRSGWTMLWLLDSGGVKYAKTFWWESTMNAKGELRGAKGPNGGDNQNQ